MERDPIAVIPPACPCIPSNRLTALVHTINRSTLHKILNRGRTFRSSLPRRIVSIPTPVIHTIPVNKEIWKRSLIRDGIGLIISIVATIAKSVVAII